MSEQTKPRKSSRKAAYWRKHINAWQESGLSQAEYSRQADISVKCLCYWKRRFKQEQNPQEPPSPPDIVAVQLPQLQEPPPEPVVVSEPRPLFVHLQNGLRIEIPGDFTAAVLEKLLKTLDRVERVERVA